MTGALNTEYAGWSEEWRDKPWEDAAPATEAIEAPRPLRREISPADPFPISALGEVMGSAAGAIVDKIMCPDAVAAGSVLAVASLAAQAHADVVLPATSRARPLSLFVATVAASGERKSAADHEALWPIQKHEENLRQAYEAERLGHKQAHRAWEVACSRAEKATGGALEIEAALRDVGREPPAPLTPVLVCNEPTLEGLHKLYAGGHPSLGLFSDEGGSFINGHAMAEETRLRTAAGLSSLWDGSPIKRIRAGDGAIVLPGRRLTMHLMAQPDAAARLLSDRTLLDQGFLSRLLVSAPSSTAGTRFQRKLQATTEPALHRYGARVLQILETPPPLLAGKRNELDPRLLEFDARAASEWLAFSDYVENMLAPGGKLEAVRGFANKIPEHLARVAGVLALSDDPAAQRIDIGVLDRAIQIVDFFATEALRLFEAGSCAPELRQAEKLLEWLHTTWKEKFIGLRAIYRQGPNSIRDSAAAKRAVSILEDHGWLVRETTAVTVAGDPVREAWRVVRRP